MLEDSSRFLVLAPDLRCLRPNAKRCRTSRDNVMTTYLTSVVLLLMSTFYYYYVQILLDSL